MDTMFEASTSRASVEPCAADGDAAAFAVAAARIAAEHKTEDVAVLDLRGLSSVADFFVIGTGTSDRQMGSVLDLIERHAKELGRAPFKLSGPRGAASWLLADYVDVVVHLFDQKRRSYYALEDLWGDAPRIAWNPRDAADGEDGLGA
jgi:ribosome-associated protein